MTSASSLPTSERLQTIARRMTDRPDLPFCVPGLAVVVRRHGERVDQIFTGVDGAGAPIREDTIFPIASASKLALGLLILQLVDRGLLGLDEPLAAYLPGAAAARPGVTVRTLLCHTSGLPLDLDPAGTPLTKDLEWAGVAAGCLATPLAGEPWARVQYSNVGYGLLALAAEQVLNEPFATALEHRVFRPLAIEAFIGREPPRRPATIVDVDSAFVGSELEPYNSEFWRRLGTPWAGIYSTASGLSSLLQAYVAPPASMVSAAALAEARRDQTRGLSGGYATTDPFLGFRGSRAISWPRCAWGLSLELRGEKRPHWTPGTASAESFGQIGASGCIAWYDPASGVAWTALAPRTTDNGWLLRHGPAIGNAALQETRAESRA